VASLGLIKPMRIEAVVAVRCWKSSLPYYCWRRQFLVVSSVSFRSHFTQSLIRCGPACAFLDCLVRKVFVKFVKDYERLDPLQSCCSRAMRDSKAGHKRHKGLPSSDCPQGVTAFVDVQLVSCGSNRKALFDRAGVRLF
jgi:hypothetical protein